MLIRKSKTKPAQLVDPTWPTPERDACLRLLLTGSRDWTETAPVRYHLLKTIAHFKIRAMDDVLVIVGEERGLDTIARELCTQELNIACATFPAAWKYWSSLGRGRAAGPMRNFRMIRWCVPHAVLAFHPYIVNSKGTKNCVNLAKENGIPWIKVVER